MSDELEPEFEDYGDFYELLGVTKPTDNDEIKQVGRELMAKHHPDVSEKDETRDIYMKINRASDVLSDPEQKKIYDSLGHEQYIQRREEGGEMELSEDMIDENGRNTGISVGGAERVEAEETQKASDQDRSGESGSGYESIDEVKIEKTPQQRVADIYSKVWGVKIAVFIAVISGLYYTNIEYVDRAIELYNSTVLADMLVTIELAVLVGVVVVMFIISGVSALYAQKRLAGVREQLHEKQKKKEKRKRKREAEKSASGLNTSSNSRASDSWDDPELDLDEITESGTLEEDKSIEQKANNSLTAGIWGVITLLFFSFISSVSPGVNVWVFTTAVLTNSDSIVPWIPMSDSLAELEVVMNMVGMGMLIFLLLITLPLVVHGLTKERWRDYFYTDEARSIWVYDGLVAGMCALFVTSLLFGGEVLYYTNMLSGGFLAKLFVLHTGYTSITSAILGLVGLVTLYFVE